MQQALNDVQLLRPDVTTDNADNQAPMRRYQILGPPTLLLLGPDGRERRG